MLVWLIHGSLKQTGDYIFLYFITFIVGSVHIFPTSALHRAGLSRCSSAELQWKSHRLDNQTLIDNLLVRRSGNCRAKHWQEETVMKSGRRMGILPDRTAPVPSQSCWVIALSRKKWWWGWQYFQWFKPTARGRAVFPTITASLRWIQRGYKRNSTRQGSYSDGKVGQQAKPRQLIGRWTRRRLLPDGRLIGGQGHEVDGSFVGLSGPSDSFALLMHQSYRLAGFVYLVSSLFITLYKQLDLSDFNYEILQQGRKSVGTFKN